MYRYMIDAADQLGHQFVLITYEQDDFHIEPEEKKRIKKELSDKNIKWIPLKWHSGSLKLIKKFYDLFTGFLAIVRFRLKGYNKIVSLATVSGSFAYVYSVIFNMRHYLYQYEPHSEFMADFGYWSRQSLSFRILNKLEYLSGKYSAIVATGTHHMIDRLNSMKSEAAVFKIPSCVDENLFEFSPSKRKSIRERLKIDDRRVLVYAGKFGGIYFEEETVRLFAHLRSVDSSFFFLILTPNPINEIEAICDKYQLNRNDYYITRVPFEEMPHYLSASDMGLVSVPAYPSQKFRSPIKVGEYLCCGSPYIVMRGISEDDEWAENENIGVVLNDFDEFEVTKAFPAIDKLLCEDKNTLRVRCRKAGVSYRGFQKFRKESIKAFVEI